MSDSSGVTISITGSSNDTNVVLNSTSGSISEGQQGLQGEKGEKGEQGLPGTPADMTRVEVLENSQTFGPFSKYGAPLFCELKQILGTNIVASDFCVPRIMDPSFVQETRAEDLLVSLLYSTLMGGSANSALPIENQAALNTLSLQIERAITAFTAAVYNKEAPHYEFTKKYGNNYFGENGLLTKENQERWFNYFMLGQGCICISTDPVLCIYSPLCVGSNNNMPLLTQFINFDLGLVLGPFNDPFSQATFQKSSKFKLSTNGTDSLDKPVLSVLNSLWKVVTRNGSKDIKFRANPKSGEPDATLPYDISDPRDLIREGYLGYTEQELVDEQALFDRCFGSAYGKKDLPLINMLSVGNLQNANNLLGRTTLENVSNLEIDNYTDVVRRFHKSVFMFALYGKLSVLANWELDVDESNKVCAEMNIPTDASSWIEGAVGDHWKYAIYKLKLHKLAEYAQDIANGVTTYTQESTEAILNDPANYSLINGEIYSGPGRVKMQEIKKYPPSRLKSNTVDEIDYFLHTDGSYCLWPESLINLLTSTGQIYFFGTPGVVVGNPITKTQHEALTAINPLLEQGYVAEYTISPTIAVNYEPVNFYILLEDRRENYVNCCLASTLGGSMFHPSLKNLVKNGCSQTNSVTDVEPNYFQVFGPKVLADPSLVVINCPKPRDPNYISKVNFFTGSPYTLELVEEIDVSYQGVYSICDPTTLGTLLDPGLDYLTQLSSAKWMEFDLSYGSQNPVSNIACAIRDRINLHPSLKSFLVNNTLQAFNVTRENNNRNVSFQDVLPLLNTFLSSDLVAITELLSGMGSFQFPAIE